MEPKELVTLWGAPDNSRLTAKQSSFRLPVHVAAKLAALADLYPAKTKTQLVGDLLAAALAQVEDGLPRFKSGRPVASADDGTPVYEASGPAQDFRDFSNKHYEQLERELGNREPGKLFKDPLYIFGDDK